MQLADYPHDMAPSYALRYLWKPLTAILSDIPARRIFELGCGNGTTASRLAGLGYDVTAVDPSESGIRFGRLKSMSARFELGSAYDDLAARYGQFPIVLSLEVVEHCFDPRAFARTVFALTQSGGVAIVSTPFHGYWKNVALAVSGKMDAHFTALWDGGHIKFWSEKTLHSLLAEAGFNRVTFARVGRIPALAKSMIAIAHRQAIK